MKVLYTFGGFVLGCVAMTALEVVLDAHYRPPITITVCNAYAEHIKGGASHVPSFDDFCKQGKLLEGFMN